MRRTALQIVKAIEPRNCFSGPRGVVLRIVHCPKRSAYVDMLVVVAATPVPGHEAIDVGEIIQMRTVAVENMIAQGTLRPLGKL